MIQPTLVVLAAGIGSRYGGLKQLDPVGRRGELTNAESEQGQNVTQGWL